ncbi:exo-alpha-sialidase [Acididesulfobacillus acetoxydans]|uniref:Exo-alpha-sialidase n=1 Tax=Acididesulfobacillus acetoxydans TaxID=1561005 RepID=A0A8S0W9V2_9FIRM|nr:cell wall-binding repeat-containing protein [Acididesulfobacillus acetoxydans]CAA7602909.1 exo-alpha-sialidase [Acididesulfobacillus acetoxydans]CEJ05790.1 N-acetylmuramoyl-L-alanine amidase LytC [Acididesulfobacillus acetoxydans]
MSWRKGMVLLGLLAFVWLGWARVVSASPTANRLEGADRYGTAVAISQTGWPNGAMTAVLATGENFPDALSAAPLARKFNAPILLTEQNELNANTAAELSRLHVKKVFIIGGVGAVSATVQTQLTTMGISTTRISGVDRYDTSVQVAKTVGVGKGIFVVSGQSFPDAVSAAPIAAALGMPVVLVPSDGLTPSLQTFLKGRFQHIYAVNGNNELGASLIGQFPNAQVISGNDRYERNANLIKYFANSLQFNSIYVATGRDYPDALTAAALAAQNQAPVVLVAGDQVPASVREMLNSEVINQINIVGGNAAVSSGMGAVLQSIPARILSLANVTASSSSTQQYQLPKTVGAILSDGSQVQVPVTWSLSSVNTGQTGNYTYTSTNTVYTYTGKVNGYSGSATLSLTVLPSTAVTFGRITAEAVLGFSYNFPATVTGTLSDKTTQQYPVTWNVSGNNVSLKKVGSYTFQGSVAGMNQKVSLTLNVVNNALVNLDDGNLQQLVRYQLTGSTTGGPLYLSDVLKITSLQANGKNISNLAGLQNFYNLTYLDLGNNQVDSTTLSNLSKLPNLKTLILNNNQLTNISGLQGLSGLQYLDVSHNDLTTFAPLSGMTQLTSLFVGENHTSDYTPLRGLYNNLIYRDFYL